MWWQKQSAVRVTSLPHYVRTRFFKQSFKRWMPYLIFFSDTFFFFGCYLLVYSPPIAPSFSDACAGCSFCVPTIFCERALPRDCHCSGVELAGKLAGSKFGGSVRPFAFSQSRRVFIFTGDFFTKKKKMVHEKEMARFLI